MARKLPLLASFAAGVIVASTTAGIATTGGNPDPNTKPTTESRSPSPAGTGFVYVRKSRLKDIDPAFADQTYPADDIRSRVRSGTLDVATFLAVPTALDCHQALGTPVMEARLTVPPRAGSTGLRMSATSRSSRRTTRRCTAG
jgi:hypothetical protein